MKIKILYEDVNILAIDKPSGLAVHADGRTKEKTLVDWILENYPKMKNVGEPMGEVLRPGIVHRLDRDTSGVMLLAKNQKTYEFLKQQFQDRKIKKTYVAIVNGWFKEDKGIVNKPIGRSPSDFRRRLAGRGARGEMKEAVTEYKVLKRFKTKAQEQSLDGRCLRLLAERSLSARRPARDPAKGNLSCRLVALKFSQPHGRLLLSHR